MTHQQLEQIKQFSLTFYQKTDQFHDTRHAELTTKYAFVLARSYPDTDLHILEAACYLHDIGRTVADKGHAYESVELAQPFLQDIQLDPAEREKILHAVGVHGIEDIHKAQSIEAKLLFDADKMQQISVYGFIRMISYEISINNIRMAEAIEDRWQRVQHIWSNLIQTPKAKEMLAPQVKEIEELVTNFRKGLEGNL